ncbi:carboxymuconolactone decarboxylase family protein [Myxococcota bacterium]|nr:carboxymuconolactone decarboxylase family protein [Myxococcota bacterium]
MKTRTERGLDVLRTLGGSAEAAQGMAGFFESLGAVGQIALRVGAGEVWARTGLSRRDRSLAVISFLTALGREVELRAHIAGGLNHGLRPEEIDEVFVQISAYAGLPFALAGAAIANAVQAEREGGAQRKTPPAPLEAKDPARRRADGLDLLKTLLGQPNLDTRRTEEQILASQGPMGELVMDYAFGDVWTRPALSRRDRSFVVISVLAATHMAHELEIHLQGALHHGVTKAEIEEMLLTLVVYGGFPRAIEGMRAAKAVFDRASGSAV